MAATSETKFGDRQWFIVERWQEYEGEGRANLLRIVAIGSFYTVHLLNYIKVIGDNPPDSYGRLSGASCRSTT